jgi:hypothetical protein
LIKDPAQLTNFVTPLINISTQLINCVTPLINLAAKLINYLKKLVNFATKLINYAAGKGDVGATSTCFGTPFFQKCARGVL